DGDLLTRQHRRTRFGPGGLAVDGRFADFQSGLAWPGPVVVAGEVHRAVDLDQLITTDSDDGDVDLLRAFLSRRRHRARRLGAGLEGVGLALEVPARGGARDLVDGEVAVVHDHDADRRLVPRNH